MAALSAARWFSVTVAGGVLSPLELCDVNGDGLPDILIVFTALMNASVMGKHHSSFHSPFCTCQYKPWYIHLAHGKSSYPYKSTLLFLLLTWLLFCDCALSCCSLFSLQASALVPVLSQSVIHFPSSHLGASPSLCPVLVHTWLEGRDKAIRKHCTTNSN